MTRFEFTDNICTLIIMMIAEGEKPLIDYVKRSAEEQRRLFDQKLSKCDGEIIRSAHQDGKAMDIYFLNDKGDAITEPKKGFAYWHKKWEEDFGGKKVIEWDQGHFEA